MNHNPRKFEEKIALNKQKQEEQNKQFEDIIRDVSNIRDNESNLNQFRSLPNIHGPPPGMYHYNMAFAPPVSHAEHFWNAEIHHGLNLQLPETQARRVLSDSQLHKSGVSGVTKDEVDGWNNHSLPRPKSALNVKSCENSISTKTSSLPDLSQNYIPVQDESYSQNILHQHYLDGIPDNLRMGGAHPQYQQHPAGGGFFMAGMSIDEATASDLQQRSGRHFSPAPSPPATSQAINYSFGSPNTSPGYQRMTAQMQEFTLHSGGAHSGGAHSGGSASGYHSERGGSASGYHSGNCSPRSPASHSGQASPDVYEIKPSLEDAIAQSQQPQYISYYQSTPTTPHDTTSYSNPPSIPKIQVYTPDEAMSPQYYPPDEEMGQDDMRQGDMRQGDMRQGDMRQGDMRQGDMRQGDMRQGDMRQGDMRQGEGGQGGSNSDLSEYLSNFDQDNILGDEVQGGMDLTYGGSYQNYPYS